MISSGDSSECILRFSPLSIRADIIFLIGMGFAQSRFGKNIAYPLDMCTYDCTCLLKAPLCASLFNNI